VIELKIRQKKAIFIFLTVSFGFFFGFAVFIKVDLNTGNLVLEKENSIRPKNSYTYSTQIIRPDDDLTNNGFTLVPGGGYLYTKIYDNVSSPTAEGDSDYIIGNNTLDTCEIEMSSITLNPGQDVTGIRVYARGQRQGTPGDINIYVSFRWRIGTGDYNPISYSTPFDEFGFYWLSTSPWTDLELSQSELNDLRIEISIKGTNQIDKEQQISVMYAELTIRSNEIPNVNLTSPIGGEILQETTNITWTYEDPEGDTITFNILYDIAGAGWAPIVSGLVNETSYEWDLSGFTQKYDQVRVKIEANDGKGGYDEDISGDYFVINIIDHWAHINLVILILTIGASVGISGIFIGNNIVKRKRKKSIKNRDSSIPYRVKQVDSVGSNHKKIIVEADLLIRRSNNSDSKDLISNLFSKNSNLLNEVIGKEGYEVVKILGKFHITTLSDDFWDKVEQFEWENNEKEEFIKDMLGLPPDCREQFIDDMLRQSKGR
jgi:hypothetical protein